MKRLPRLAALTLVLLCTPIAGAAVEVGSTPKLAFKATNGQMVDLTALKGKYVVIDFWATWCGPCMAEAAHMVQINEAYGKRGLVFLGISLDSDLNKMKEVCAQENFTWPQQFDGKGWANTIAQEWGVRSIPKTFIIDPDGKVLWSGHPGSIDRPLKEAFEKNPPVLMDAKAFAAAQSAIAEVEKQLTAKNAAGALRALAAVPALAKEDSRTSPKMTDLQTAVSAAAEAMLAEVQPLIDKKDFAGALTRLRDISTSMKDTPTGDQARDQLAELSAKPEVKTQLAAMERASKAEIELSAARQMQTAKQHEQAYARFKVVATQFTGTPAAVEAGTQVSTYEKDTAFMKKMNEAAIGSKARSAISLAKAYAGSGKPDLAAKKLQSVIDEFPGTSFADEAKREMAALKR